jgi:hypothetical protein
MIIIIYISVHLLFLILIQCRRMKWQTCSMHRKDEKLVRKTENKRTLRTLMQRYKDNVKILKKYSVRVVTETLLELHFVIYICIYVHTQYDHIVSVWHE